MTISGNHRIAKRSLRFQHSSLLVWSLSKTFEILRTNDNYRLTYRPISIALGERQSVAM